MIKGATTMGEMSWCRQTLLKAKVIPSPFAHMLMWFGRLGPTWVVAYDDWLGRTCMMYMASTVAYPPKAFRWAVFNYPFNILQMKRVFGMVKSDNTAAMRLDLHLGFKEVYRAEECAEDGHDIVLLEMRAENWRAQHGR